MINPNNQNYFALDSTQPGALAPAPMPPLWWRRRAVQMRILAVIGIAIGVGVVGYYAWQTYSLTHVDVNKIEQAQTMIDRAAQSCAEEEDVAACEARARSAAAQATGEVSVCKGLESNAYENCVSMIARDTMSTEPCAALSGSQETQCADSVNLLLAQQAQNYGLCGAIIDSAKRETCRAQMLPYAIAAGECEKHEIDAASCAFPAELEKVIASGNPEGCSVFSGEQKDGCVDMFSSLDRDGDGLSRAEEYALGTSDDSADSDGDGYTDGDEVAAGYDPLH